MSEPTRSDPRWVLVSDVPEAPPRYASLGLEVETPVTYTQTWELYDEAGHQHVITERHVAARARTEMPPL